MGMESLATAPEADVIQAIFLDGFTTNESVDKVAGRGVGTSAILAETKRLGGSMVVNSEAGKGISFSIRDRFLRSSLVNFRRCVVGRFGGFAFGFAD